MKIDEFMGIVNRVAYVKRRNMRIDIYSSGNNYYGDWFLSINPHQEDLNIGYNWKYLDLEPNKLITVITAVAKLKATPVKERFPEKKYTVQVFHDDEEGYLNIDKNNGEPLISTSGDELGYKTQFTQQEIEILKRRSDLAIDWDKAKIEGVEEQ